MKLPESHEDSWSSDRKKARVTATLPKKLKKQVKSELEYSSITMSDLVREKFREFLDEEVNEDFVYDRVEELTCDSSDCKAIFYDRHLKKTEGVCPGCGSEVTVK